MEAHEVRLRRLKLRSMRRGIREMDLLLSAFAEGPLAAQQPAILDRYEALLQENDIDLLAWVTGAQPAPPDFAELVALIAQGQVAAPR